MVLKGGQKKTKEELEVCDFVKNLKKCPMIRPSEEKLASQTTCFPSNPSLR